MSTDFDLPIYLWTLISPFDLCVKPSKQEFMYYAIVAITTFEYFSIPWYRI